MSEQSKKHLNEVNDVVKDLVAVVQYEETKDVLILQLNGQDIVLNDGVGEVEYHGKQYPVEVDVEDMGDVPDEEVIDEKQPFKPLGVDTFDPIEKTTVTHPEANPFNFIKVPGRTVVDAVIYLTVNGKDCQQEPYYAGKGSHVFCQDGTVLWRYAFVVPVRVFTGKGKSLPDE